MLRMRIYKGKEALHEERSKKEKEKRNRKGDRKVNIVWPDKTKVKHM